MEHCAGSCMRSNGGSWGDQNAQYARLHRVQHTSTHYIADIHSIDNIMIYSVLQELQVLAPHNMSICRPACCRSRACAAGRARPVRCALSRAASGHHHSKSLRASHCVPKAPVPYSGVAGAASPNVTGDTCACGGRASAGVGPPYVGAVMCKVFTRRAMAPCGSSG